MLKISKQTREAYIRMDLSDHQAVRYGSLDNHPDMQALEAFRRATLDEAIAKCKRRPTGHNQSQDKWLMLDFTAGAIEALKENPDGQ